MATLARGFMTFGSLTLVSRVAGFLRDMLTAAMLGAGPVADAYAVASRLPNLFRTLFAEGAFNAAFLPLFKKIRYEEGTQSAHHFAESIQAVMVLVLLIFTAVMMIAMPTVIHVIAPGFADEPTRYALAVTYGQITFPYLFFISLTALQGGVLNSLGSLGPFAAAPIILNLVQIFGLLVIAPYVGTPGIVLSWGMTVGGLLQFLWLAYFCQKQGIGLRWRRPQLTPSVRLFFRKLGPGVIGASAAQVNLAVSTMLASLLPAGGVAYLYYADRLNQLPLGVVGIALYTALLPLLTDAVHEKNETKIRETTSRAIDMALLLGLPSAFALMLLGTPILGVLFARGAFTLVDAQQTAYVLAAYAVGIPAFMLVRILAARFQATGDTKTPVRIGMVAITANIAFAVWLLPLFRLWSIGGVGIALATSLATWLNFGLLVWRLRQRDGDILDVLSRRRIPRLWLCTVAMGAVSWGVAQGFGDRLYLNHILFKVLALGVVMGSGMLTYAGALHLTGTVKLTEIKSLLRRRK